MDRMAARERITESSIEAIKKKIGQDRISYEHVYHLENDNTLVAVVSKEQAGRYLITLLTDLPGPLLLHWGVARRFLSEWTLPSPSLRPEKTTLFQNSAARTPFPDQAEQSGQADQADQSGFRRLQLRMSEQEAPRGISFVLLKAVDSGQWIKDHGRNFSIPVIVPAPYSAALGDPGLAALAESIIDKEVNSGSWTLMHRFNLCHDLLDKIGRGNLEGLAIIFVWLRFSAIRQLDWQRNYNTKPSELSQAENRLTLKLADCLVSAGGSEERELIRLIMTTLGRGGEGQKVRDEVLNIMHRRGISETSGHFLEQWHQKLHNNTTPDDVVICEAYLDFLKNNGNLDLFYQRLIAGGITKERLESYERPIRSHPEFRPHLKDALICDFSYFLGILKSVHSGIDLGIAMQSARYLFDAGMPLDALMDFIWSHQADPWMPPATLVENITEGRRRLKGRFQGPSYQVRDLLFLDIALEEFLRVVVERTSYSHLEGNQLVDLVGLMLENLCLSRPDDAELGLILRYFSRLKQMPRFGKDWSLRAEAALSRMRNSLSRYIDSYYPDSYYRLFQPRAEFLGEAFRAEKWTITLFSEEVVRGRPAFVLAMLLRSLNPILRQSADLGNWQIISPNRAVGEVESVDMLRSVQDKRFARPTVIIADDIAGDENIPEGAVAVITADSVDIVSHIAIRARNAGLLFATCYDHQIIKRLKSLKGQVIKLYVDSSGAVLIEERPESQRLEAPKAQPPKPSISQYRPGFTAYAVSMSDFNEHNVGSKSNNLKRLQGKLPEWIHLPTSVSLPYGVFERVLDERINRDIARQYRELTRQLDGEEKAVGREGSGQDLPHPIEKLRRTILALKAPDELIFSLRQVMEKTGLAWPDHWDEAWMSIKQVWGSQWNERAYLSRRASGISHKDIFMAVLIQRVVEAEYSFVIHTVNPIINDRDTMYAEAVLGLGETLVSGYPGRSLGFTCGKGEYKPQFLAFPSKSVGLFGAGLIFRSDFSGEDLANYAGAGLYSSIMLPQPRKALLDYTDERLVWDDDFRRGFLTAVVRIGAIVEEILRTPQDIEGAYSRERYYVVQARPQVGVESK